jgi:hypothetical protein
LDANQTGDASGRPSDLERTLAGAWLEACDAGCLDTPLDVRDADAWDEYWDQHIKVGLLELGMSDMMSSDSGLVDLLSRRGAETILCAGNGMSMEAVSLALFGFHVTALDIAKVPALVLARAFANPEDPVRQIPGFQARDDGSIVFAEAVPLDTLPMPVLHCGGTVSPRGGGSLTFATGDLLDPHVCPGPFDVVLERRTLQLFPVNLQLEALERLVARLAPRGTFVSHQHSGGWRPGEVTTHFAEAWLAARGFSIRRDPGRQEDEMPDRVAHLLFSTG